MKELRWNAEILFRVLEAHEPDHPLLEQASREAEHTFLDVRVGAGRGGGLSL